MKFATKPIRQYPPHLRYVATLPEEIKNSNFLQIWKKMQSVKHSANTIDYTYQFVMSSFHVLDHFIVFSALFDRAV